MSALKRSSRGFLASLTALAVIGLGAASAQAAPVLEINTHHAPTKLGPGTHGNVSFLITNVGDEPLVMDSPLVAQLQLGEGLTTRLGHNTSWVIEEYRMSVHPRSKYMDTWDCAASPDPVSEPGHDSATCVYDASWRPGFPLDRLPAGESARFMAFVAVEEDAVGPVEASLTISGGAITPVTAVESVPLDTSAPEFGVVPGSFKADAFDAEGLPLRQAGDHPFRASATFDISTKNVPAKDFSGDPAQGIGVVAPTRTVDIGLPRGFIGIPTAVGQCRFAQLQYQVDGGLCPSNSQVGVVDIAISSLGGGTFHAVSRHLPFFNMTPAPGALAEFGFQVEGRPVAVRAYLDPRDYSVGTRVRPINEFLPVQYSSATLWGVPGDPAHDESRWNPEGTWGLDAWGADFDLPVKPFLTLPSECGVADTTDLTVASWLTPTQFTAPVSSDPFELNGCNRLEFKPTIEARPTTNLADAPSGFEFTMRIPQNEDPEGLGTPPLRDATVTLPPGMTVNPPSADGLDACSMSEVGIDANGKPTTFTGADGLSKATPNNCPDASKLGTVEAVSPAVDHPLPGSVYLAEQNANPFNSLLAMYLVIEDPETGVLVKLPGRVDPDQQTGQLTATFKNNPQLPVEELRLKLKEGPRAALKTPGTCGTYETTGTLTPWSAPESPSAGVVSSFELSKGPSGGACVNGGAGAPNTPAFSAGTVDPTAKAFSPFVMRLARADGTQQIKAIDTTLPKGLLAKLAGTTYCADAALAAASGKSGKAEQAQASCPASSHVGVVNVGAGAGSTPLYVQGQAYLAGPYKGAPLSLAIVTPAVAGPFDLGTVVVRTALNVNSETAQVRAVSDELPTILQGIPLNIRSIALQMNRPQFTLNPTSCNPMSIDGSALTIFNQSAPLSNPFQVGECNRLGFKPKLQIKLKGSTKRAGHPALTAVVSARPGDANIATASVALPRSEFLAQDHIRTICTRVQFSANACPQGSIYGTASATTPLLDEVLTGNVYLRSSSNPLPDMVIALKGKIDVDLVGRIDTDKNGGIRTTFAQVPDAPVSKFTLRMQGGKKSLLENSKNLCSSTNKATLRMGAQNGAAHEARPVVKSAGCKTKARKGKGGKGKPRKRRGGKR